MLISSQESAPSAVSDTFIGRMDARLSRLRSFRNLRIRREALELELAAVVTEHDRVERELAAEHQAELVLVVPS